MALRMSTFIGLISVVLVVGFALTALTLSLLQELEAKRRAVRLARTLALNQP